MTKKEILSLPADYDLEIKFHLSNSAIRMFENCNAHFIYSREIMPKVETKESTGITGTGSIFHKIAENNFDLGIVNEYVANLSSDDAEEIRLLSETGRKRGYITSPDTQNFQNEARVETKLNEAWSLVTIPDRRIVMPDGTIRIYDWKTGRKIRASSDEHQGLLYCFSEVIKHGTKPHAVSAFFDYVRYEDFEPFEYLYSEQKYSQTINYLSGVYKQIYRTVKEYRERKDINKIVHSPGEHCTLCPRCGNCPAYRAYYVPDMDGDIAHPETMDVGAIISELKERSEVLAAVKNRVEVLKRSLVNIDERYQSAREAHAEIDPKLKSAYDTLKTYGSVIRSDMKFIPTDLFLSKQLPEIIEHAIKASPLARKMDTTALLAGLVDILKPVLPPSLSASIMSKEILDENPGLIRKSSKAAYFSMKK